MTFRYDLSENLEQRIYDFYFLIGYCIQAEVPIEKHRLELEYMTKEVIDKQAEEFKLYVRWSLSAELRHVFDGHTGDSNVGQELFKLNYGKDSIFYDMFRKINMATKKRFVGRKIDDVERLILRTDSEHNEKAREEAYCRLFAVQDKNENWSDLILASFMEKCFAELRWSSGYGGKKWAQIAQGYARLLKATTYNEKIIAIDHIYDLVHNGGPAINKVPKFIDTCQINGSGWFTHALDFKKENSSILKFRDRVSPELRSIVVYVSKYNKR